MKLYDELQDILKKVPGIAIKKSFYRMIGVKYLKNPLPRSWVKRYTIPGYLKESNIHRLKLKENTTWQFFPTG
jgi:hypothetical protein